MDISFSCNKCQQQIVIDVTAAGQLVDCPKCGTPLEVPHKSEPLSKTITPSPSTTGRRERIGELAPAKSSSSFPKALTVLVIISTMVIGGFFAYMLWKKHVPTSRAETRTPDTASTAPTEAPRPSPSKASMQDDQYFDYLKTKSNGEPDPVKRVELMQSYLSAYPQGRHMGEAMALLEKAQVDQRGEPKKQELALLLPLADKYAQMEAAFAQGMSYPDFNRALAEIKAEYKKIEASGLYSDPSFMAFAQEVMRPLDPLDHVSLFWSLRQDGDRLIDNGAYDTAAPPASTAKVQDWLTRYPELKGALFSDGPGKYRFFPVEAYPIMMRLASDSMKKARLKINERYGR